MNYVMETLSMLKLFLVSREKYVIAAFHWLCVSDHTPACKPTCHIVSLEFSCGEWCCLNLTCFRSVFAQEPSHGSNQGHESVFRLFRIAHFSQGSDSCSWDHIRALQVRGDLSASPPRLGSPEVQWTGS